MKKKLLTLVLVLFACTPPLFPIVNGRSLTVTLRDLCYELQTDYAERSEAEELFYADYDHQHQKLINILKGSDELSLLL